MAKSNQGQKNSVSHKHFFTTRKDETDAVSSDSPARHTHAIPDDLLAIASLSSTAGPSNAPESAIVSGSSLYAATGLGPSLLVSAVTHATGSHAAVTPTLTIDPIAGDNAVSIYEGQFGLEIAGKSSQLAVGTLVTLTLDGKSWQGVVEDKAGTWHVDVPAQELAAIQDGHYTLNVSAGSGATATAARDIWLVTHASSESHFTVNEVTASDVSWHDGDSWVTLSGTLDGTIPIVAASVNPNDYPLYNLVMGENRTWSVAIRESDLQFTDGYNTMLFGVKDAGGNWFEHPQSVKVHLEGAASLTAFDGDQNGDDGTAALAGVDDHLAHADDGSSLLSAPHSAVATEAKTTLDLTTLGLKGQEAAHPADHKLTGADVHSSAPVNLHAPEGGVWNAAATRADAQSLTEHLPAHQENTLADVLAQHALQQTI